MSYFDDRSLFSDEYIREFPDGYFDSLEYKTQLSINRALRSSEFKQHALKFTNYVPNDFTIQISESQGKINTCVCSIVHYGYEDSYNNGVNSFSDLSDCYSLGDDPEISDVLRTAAFSFIKMYKPEIWEIIKDSKMI